MKEYLEKAFSEEPINENPKTPLKTIFFRLYDRKIASGEIGFNNLKMDKDAFICLSTNQDPEMSRDDIISLCVNMRLTQEEAESMMLSAGYVLVE